MINRYPSLRIGYSDHTSNSLSCIAAIALGAQVIEKHICIDFDVPNTQDWKVSCGPHNFKQFCTDLRETYDSIGSGSLDLQPDEELSVKWAVKKLIYSCNYSRNDVLEYSGLSCVRSSEGLQVSCCDQLIGKRLNRPVKIGDLVSSEHFDD